MQEPIKPEYPKVHPDIIYIYDAQIDSEFNQSFDLNKYISKFNSPIQNIRLRFIHDKESGWYGESWCIGGISLEIFSDEDIKKVIDYEQKLENYNFEYKKYDDFKFKRK